MLCEGQSLGLWEVCGRFVCLLLVSHLCAVDQPKGGLSPATVLDLHVMDSTEAVVTNTHLHGSKYQPGSV